MTQEEIEVLQDIVDMYRQEFGAGDSRYEQAMVILSKERAAQQARADVCPQSPDGKHHYHQDYEIGHGVVFDCDCGKRRTANH